MTSITPTWGVVPAVYAAEWLLLGVTAFAVLILPTPVASIRCLRSAIDAVARRRRVPVITVILMVLIGRVALLPKIPIPKPAIADEFGYLLTADTFAHGRLTNPTPALWKHFETFHVFFIPTYQSQYPIGYPVILAIAQLLTKQPWWGVYITTALMCGALTWMLQAWVPPFWAFIGGLIAVFRFALFTYWMNSYWGGSLAALGGCLVFGALPRLFAGHGRPESFRSARRLHYALAMAVGFVLLITTRPYEGFVVCLPLAAVMAVRLIKGSRTEKLATLERVLVPIGIVLCALFAFLALYQYRVTGHAFESPYEVASRQYHVSRPFIFQQPLPIPTYNHLELRYIYVHFEALGADRMHYFWGYVDALKDRCTWYWQFFAGPVMTLPFLFALLTLRRKRLRLVWFALIALAIGVAIESWIQVHYLAPAFGLFILLLVEGLRTLRTVRIGRYRLGRRLVFGSALVCVAMLIFRVILPGNSAEGPAHWPPNWAYSTMQLVPRNRIEDRLKSEPGNHLVLVRYHIAFHSPHEEYVYNEADLDQTRILWARSMNAAQNCDIAQAYRGQRKLWVVDNWGGAVRLLPETEREVCDPKNFIYQKNQPIGYYYPAITG